MIKKSTGLKTPKRTISNYKITYNVIPEPNFDRLPEQVKSRITEIHNKLRTDSHRLIPELIELITKYPNVPVLRNYLGVAYSAIGKTDKLEEVTMQLLKNNPDYLFGRLNYAQLCLMRKEYGKILEIFDYTFDLNELYPDRDEFHISEFVNFMAVVGEYYFHTGNRDQAQKIHDLLKDIAPDDHNTANMRYLLS